MTRKLEAGALDPAVLFATLLRREGLPVPVTEHRFAPPRRWRMDYAWLDARLALEVEGGVWTHGRHTRGAGFLADVEKYNAATLLGWRLLRTTPDTLLTMETVAMIRAALAYDPSQSAA